MTFKEAAEIISDYEIYSCGYCHMGGDEVKEAFDIAIKVLRGDRVRKLTVDEIKNRERPVVVELVPICGEDDSLYCFAIPSEHDETMIKFVIDGWFNSNGVKIFKTYGCELKFSEHEKSWICWEM